MKICASIVVALLSWVWLLAAFGQLMPKHWTWRWWAFPVSFTVTVLLTLALAAVVVVVNQERK